MWVLRLIVLVLVLVVATSALASSASTIATSTSVVKFVSSIAISHHWILTAGVQLHLLLSMEIVVTFVLISYEVDNVENLLLSSFLMLVFDVILGLPEVHSEWFHAISKAAGLIEIFDAFLGILNTLVEHITDLIVRESLTIDALLMILKLDGGNLTSLGELLMELFLSDVLWDELNENVRFVRVLQVLGNWVRSSTETELVLLSIDVRSNKKSLISNLLLHVDTFDGSLGLLMSFEANEAGTVVLGVHGARVDITVLPEDVSKLAIFEALWQVSDEEIGVSALTLLFSLVLLGVDENLDDFSVLLGTVEFFNSFLSALLSLKLNVTLTSTVTAGESFEFA